MVRDPYPTERGAEGLPEDLLWARYIPSKGAKELQSIWRKYVPVRLSGYTPAGSKSMGIEVYSALMFVRKTPDIYKRLKADYDRLEKVERDLIRSLILFPTSDPAAQAEEIKQFRDELLMKRKPFVLTDDSYVRRRELMR